MASLKVYVGSVQNQKDRCTDVRYIWRENTIVTAGILICARVAHSQKNVYRVYL